ncbi:transcription initiation factor IID, 31kD subunit-domain-containing protein [Globomyces pollinis-pini]|nr:transcription initiation factor IID, 31kD subunit-domain-containing protein [Globomyces pollinis-pini]
MNESFFRGDPADLPPSARLLSLILQGAGVEDYDPRVLAQLYEIAHSYIVNVLQDGQVLCEHAQRKELNVADIKLAIETRAALDFTRPPSRQALVELAAKKNSIPLPLVPEKFGLRLPPERHCLIRQNISINPRKRTAMDIDSPNARPVQVHPNIVHPLSKPISFQPQAAINLHPTPMTAPVSVMPTTMPTTTNPATNVDDDYDMED